MKRDWICWRCWPVAFLVSFIVVCAQDAMRHPEGYTAQAAELPEVRTFPLETGTITLDHGYVISSTQPKNGAYNSSAAWDVPPEECQSKTYEWIEASGLKCIGRVIQDSGVPLLEPGLRGAVMESQRDFHLGAQKMYRLKAAVYLTPQWLSFRNAEELMKRGSEAMEKLQDMARAICRTGNTEYNGPMVACVKTETAGGLIAKALSTGSSTKGDKK